MVERSVIRNKRNRIRERKYRPRVVDLFSGCGGLSLGFDRAGYEICGAIEADEHAAKSHAINFARGYLPEWVEHHAQPRDIRHTDPNDFVEQLGIRGLARNAIDVLVGGPPCQAFARIGRAKLREIAKRENAHQDDERSSLFVEYVRFVQELMPLAIVLENVPDMMNHGGHNVAAEACALFEELGYECRYTFLNAVHYGVPQYRERVFLIGFHRDLRQVPKFPRNTHYCELPTGYLGSRSVAFRPIMDNGGSCEWFIEPQRLINRASPSVTCRDALADLPQFTSHLEDGIPRRARCMSCETPYPNRRKLSEYATLMREWKGFESSSGITGHAIRYLKRDFETFARMMPGDQYPRAHEIAEQRFHEAIASFNGNAPRKGTKAYKALWDSIVPPYDKSKFPNKWWKLDPDEPSKTLTAHIGKDTYSHIHYDDKQARTISVREAARLQSFPDGFLFSGAMNAAFRQIGNAVPPLVAYAIARQIKRDLRSTQVSSGKGASNCSR